MQKIVDKKNIKVNDKKPLLDYLNAQAQNDFLFLGVLQDQINVILPRWAENGWMSKEEAKDLKYAITYIGKFYDSVISRQNERSKKGILSRLTKYHIEIMDEYTRKKIYDQANKALEVRHLDQDEFYIMAHDVLDNCQGCQVHSTECVGIYDFLDRNFCPESPDGLPNCKYASKTDGPGLMERFPPEMRHLTAAYKRMIQVLRKRQAEAKAKGETK